LARGGFPESLGVAARDRFELLRGYVDTTLLRDVIERHAVSNPVALRWMVRHCWPIRRHFQHKQVPRGSPFAKHCRAKDTLHAYLDTLKMRS